MLKVTEGASIRLLTVFSGAGGFLPRRCCSAVTAACNWSSSWSLRCLIADGRSPGSICRDDVAGLGGRETASCADAAAKRSGVIGPLRLLPTRQACRHSRKVAMKTNVGRVDFRGFVPPQCNAAQSLRARQHLQYLQSPSAKQRFGFWSVTVGVRGSSGADLCALLSALTRSARSHGRR